ncbi:MAG: KpsF/GutQ family sugar-phosphate isomerase [Blastopirellula sp.]|nr:MAG: KpsF/GutQ family sugar-phosphate isomerase [Blastopirellula sp.]
MNHSALPTNIDCSATDARESWVRTGRRIIRQEAKALTQLELRLNESFGAAISAILECRGSVIVTGMGKAGLIGKKITATFASTGTPSHFLHPAEAVHGDLGRIGKNDLVLAFSQSGETAEIINILPSIQEFGTPIISVTATRTSSLGKASAVVLELGNITEACNNQLAPSASTAAMMALGDALALTCSEHRNFQPADFARFHPGGNLGKKLAPVEQLMRPLSECRVAQHQLTVREVFSQAHLPGRRSGAIMLCNELGQLVGIFTDSDLARLFEQGENSAFEQPIHQVMTQDPRRIEVGTQLHSVIEKLANEKLSELPVVDQQGTPVGMIDITDIVSQLPNNFASSANESKSIKPASLIEEKDNSRWTVPFPNQSKESS